MSLEIDVQAGVGRSEVEAMESGWNHLDHELTELMREGFKIPDQPHEQPPKITAEFLNSMTPEGYHNYVSALSAWKTYTAYRVITIDRAIKSQEKLLKKLTARLRINIRASIKPKPSEDQIKDMVAIDPEYVRIEQQIEQLTTQRDLRQPLLDSFNKDLQILSRALELRRQELETLHARNLQQGPSQPAYGPGNHYPSFGINGR